MIKERKLKGCFNLLEEERLMSHYSRKKKQLFDPTVEETTKSSSKVLQTFLKPDEEVSTIIPELIS